MKISVLRCTKKCNEQTCMLRLFLIFIFLNICNIGACNPYVFEQREMASLLLLVL